MDIRSQVKQQLDDLLQQNVSGKQCLHIPLPTGELRAEMLDVQPLGCALWRLEVRTHWTAQATAAELESAGETLARRVCYLLEPLKLHEIDRQRTALQLRSFPPQREAGTVCYFEVTAQRDGAWQIARYEKPPAQPRQQVPAIVTPEVLQRLCQDVVDVASR